MRGVVSRLTLSSARGRRGALLAGAVVLTALPVALFGRRVGMLVLDHYQDLWPAAQAAGKTVGSWSGGTVAAVLGMLSRVGLDVCGSVRMRDVRDVVARVARTEATVVLAGESGVGKEVVARAIHAGSPRAAGPFVKVNCAAVPSELLESEFFGHERGAFTSAVARTRGHFERADGGTLFLDEIAELPPSLQAKLLHALQDGVFYRVGGTDRVEVDVRVIAATNRDLAAAVRAGEFREDLYYRLNVVEIRVPPLRERREDIPALVEHFRERCEREYGRAPRVSHDTLELFARYDWPGNVRELETMVRRIAVLDGDETVRRELAERLAGAARAGAAPAAPVNGAVSLKAIARSAARDAERGAIVAVLSRVHWNRTRAARILGISYRGLLYKLAELGLSEPEDGAGGAGRIGPPGDAADRTGA